MKNSSCSNRTIKLKLRSSLLKRKEKQIILSRPSSPEQHGMASPRSVPSQKTHELGLSRLCVPPTDLGRERTVSEAEEWDDQIMPLPKIRSRARKWKSCSNVQALLQENQLRRWHSRPEMSGATAGAVAAAGCSSPENSRKAGNSNLRKHIFPLSEVDEKKRRALILMRRSGRQLSDPSGYRTPKIMFAAAADHAGTVAAAASSRYRRKSSEDQRSSQRLGLGELSLIHI